MLSSEDELIVIKKEENGQIDTEVNFNGKEKSQKAWIK